MVTATIEHNKVVVREDGKHRRSFPASQPAYNSFGNETGRTWAEEVAKGNPLIVGQWKDGDNYGRVWVY